MNEEEKKAIERCKKLIKETHSCWIGLSNQEAIKTILNLSEKQKVEIENKQDEINVLEAQRDSIENQFEQAKTELEKKDKESHFIQSELDIANAKIIKLNNIIDLMAEWIEKHTKYYDEDGCYCEVEKDICNKNIECEDCIKEYFTKKVEEDK